MHVLHTEFGLY